MYLRNDFEERQKNAGDTICPTRKNNEEKNN